MEENNKNIKSTDNENCHFERIVIPQAKYGVIYADPPWRYSFSNTNNRKIENHYPTMEVEEIKKMRVPASEDCILFLWATAPKLEEALEVIKAWGFKYKTHAIWDKKKMGLGYWFRGRHELLLVGTKGNVSPPPREMLIESIFAISRSKHSKKPQAIRDKIKEWYPTKTKLELFARKPNELFVEQDFAGWHVWGNQC